MTTYWTLPGVLPRELARRRRRSTCARQLSRGRRHLCQNGIAPQRGLRTAPRHSATNRRRSTLAGRPATPKHTSLLAIGQRHTIRPRSRSTTPRNGITGSETSWVVHICAARELLGDPPGEPWDCSEDAAQSTADQLVEVGFFERRQAEGGPRTGSHSCIGTPSHSCRALREHTGRRKKGRGVRGDRDVVLDVAD